MVDFISLPQALDVSSRSTPAYKYGDGITIKYDRDILSEHSFENYPRLDDGPT